ncbi:MAG TPA: hypothetical protein VHC69_12785 [Polyangiaceae bacterium]|nr:hypothetical protein [Polyangiaceae bacterium]
MTNESVTSPCSTTHEVAADVLAMMQRVPEPGFNACPPCRAVEFLLSRDEPENLGVTLWLAEQCACGGCGPEFVEETRAEVSACAKRDLARSISDMLIADPSTLDTISEPRLARFVRGLLAPVAPEEMTTRGSQRAKLAARKPPANRTRTRRRCG